MNKHDKTPLHIALVMDGNGRWAASQGRERAFGHASGTESVRACIRAALSTGVRYLTLYAFSTENWERPREEVEGLMDLLCDSIAKESPELARQGVRVMVIGARAGLSERVRRHIEAIESETAGGKNLTVVLAVNYSARSELVRAASLIAADAIAGGLSPVMITEAALAEKLYTAEIPDPDMIVRTGGEQRLSNFLLWQAAYSELYFTPVMWPDFGEEEFRGAVEEYGRRERRFGKLTNSY
ncbi:MAG: di-trans,poly-cis-decaprenylcistransferase [Alistipes sp.]|jgi:undecaprenyl diphosphate synthase|nr:di-trans,poly-cis-decaprenylcistransferase [Alistipes sp.]